MYLVVGQGRESKARQPSDAHTLVLPRQKVVLQADLFVHHFYADALGGSGRLQVSPKSGMYSRFLVILRTPPLQSSATSRANTTRRKEVF